MAQSIEENNINIIKVCDLKNRYFFDSNMPGKYYYNKNSVWKTELYEQDGIINNEECIFSLVDYIPHDKAVITCIFFGTVNKTYWELFICCTKGANTIIFVLKNRQSKSKVYTWIKLKNTRIVYGIANDNHVALLYESSLVQVFKKDTKNILFTTYVYFLRERFFFLNSKCSAIFINDSICYDPHENAPSKKIKNPFLEGERIDIFGYNYGQNFVCENKLCMLENDGKLFTVENVNTCDINQLRNARDNKTIHVLAKKIRLKDSQISKDTHTIFSRGEKNYSISILQGQKYKTKFCPGTVDYYSLSPCGNHVIMEIDGVISLYRIITDKNLAIEQLLLSTRKGENAVNNFFSNYTCDLQLVKEIKKFL
jgi:hypothetical protein